MDDSATGSRRGRLLAKLSLIGQEHLLAFWDRLDPTGRRRLAAQLDEVDPDVFCELQMEFRGNQESGTSENSKWAALAAKAQSPPAMRLDGSGVRFSQAEARTKGAEILRAGQVGMILVAGGLGTRLGVDQPKGMFPIGPLSGRTLFQVLLEQL